MNNLEARCNSIEECYEFMLAFAAQGLDTDAGEGRGGQIRGFLQGAAEALSGLGDVYASTVKEEGMTPPEPYAAFHVVLDADARNSLAAVQLVLAQPAISSQLIDNLNASIHLRALLTDLFLVDEILKLHQNASKSAITG